jgi:hypothetical protein
MLVYIQRRSARPDGVGQECDAGEQGRSKSVPPQDNDFPRCLPFHRAIERNVNCIKVTFLPQTSELDIACKHVGSCLLYNKTEFRPHFVVSTF